jgi:hypothetical protein
MTSTTISYADTGLLFDRSELRSADARTTAPADWTSHLQGFLTKLGRLMELEQDWDSYGGVPASSTAVVACEGLVLRLGPTFRLPAVYPLPTGGIGLEWESKDAEVTIEVDANGFASLLVESGGRTEAKLLTAPISKLLLEFSNALEKRIPRVV